jgi:HupE / UreJ protein
MRLARWFAAVALLVAAAGAAAHKPSDSYLALRVEGAAVTGQWDIALRDLEHAIGLDADGDGAITWGELKAQHTAIAAYAGSRLVLQADGRPCTLAIGAQQVDEHTDGAYTVLPLAFDCGGAAPAATLGLGYTLFAELDPQHRGLLRLVTPQGTRTAVLDPAKAAQAFALDGAAAAGAGGWAAFVQYLKEGVWHIWIGFDHILFLLALLLPAVGAWNSGRWMPAASLHAASIEVLKVVTAFTLAHSITLSLATLGLVSLPSRLVESVIAASVVLAALNNVWPLFRGGRWWVAFAFGLVHGFGFASVLADLGLPGSALALALLGFNVGVELGQLAIVLVFLPLAFALRRTLLYRRGVLVGGSLVVALLAAAWFFERAFEVQLLPA